MDNNTKEVFMVEVFHNSDFIGFGFKLIEGKVPDVPKKLLEKVADVKAESLEAAYCLTNNTDCDWTQHKEVTAVKDKIRSTSMGDVMKANGITYIVANYGFKNFVGGFGHAPLSIELPQEHVGIGGIFGNKSDGRLYQ